MKPIYKSLALASIMLKVGIALNAQTYDGTTTSETALPAEVLDSLCVKLVAPDVSGARDLIKSGECTIDGSRLSIVLNAANWIKGATYCVQVIATFGTQTQVIYAMYVTVPYYIALSDTSQEYEDTIIVVSTVGDGDKSGADATVYSKDGDGNAHITTPLNVNGSVSEGQDTTADGNSSHAEGQDTTASGAYSHAEGERTNASGVGSHAEGVNTTASGAYSHAEGNGTIASQETQHVCGRFNVVDEDDSFLFIVGNGTDDEHRQNAFAITQWGELALFEADGTPVILTPADLKALIASL